jgi:hypothetical protein
VRDWRSVPSGLGSTSGHPILWRPAGILRRRREGIRLEDESALTRPVGHPQQRDLSQRTVGIATADVAVHAGEPHLFDVLVGPWVAGPLGGPERAAPLVDGQGALESLPPVDADPPRRSSVVAFRPVDIRDRPAIWLTSVGHGSTQTALVQSVPRSVAAHNKSLRHR